MDMAEAMRQTQEQESEEDNKYKSSGYLPMDCPICGRHRLQWFMTETSAITLVKCEKCERAWDTDDI